jgi:hypothetical protein
MSAKAASGFAARQSCCPGACPAPPDAVLRYHHHSLRQFRKLNDLGAVQFHRAGLRSGVFSEDRPARWPNKLAAHFGSRKINARGDVPTDEAADDFGPRGFCLAPQRDAEGQKSAANG